MTGSLRCRSSWPAQQSASCRGGTFGGKNRTFTFKKIFGKLCGFFSPLLPAVGPPVVQEGLLQEEAVVVGGPEELLGRGEALAPDFFLKK